jgi:hypothetical protein
MLISWLIFTKLFKPHQIKEFRDERKVNENDYKHTTIENILWYCILLLFLLFNVVPAVLIAFNCNKNNIGHLIISFLFSDIYVFNYTLRKYVFRDGYCSI